MLVEAGEWFPLNREHFKQIIEGDNGKLRLNHKLKNIHVDMPTGARTNVRLAAQTLSRSTALALEYLFPECQPQAEVIKVLDNVS